MPFKGMFGRHIMYIYIYLGTAKAQKRKQTSRTVSVFVLYLRLKMNADWLHLTTHPAKTIYLYPSTIHLSIIQQIHDIKYILPCTSRELCNATWTPLQTTRCPSWFTPSFRGCLNMSAVISTTRSAKKYSLPDWRDETKKLLIHPSSIPSLSGRFGGNKFGSTKTQDVQQILYLQGSFFASP